VLSRCPDYKFRNELKNDDYMSSSSMCNIAEELLNFVAETTGCKQFVSCVLIQKMTDSKMIHNEK